jgi:ABC-2 type transport system permease protein
VAELVSAVTRGQLAAIARVRWQLVFNSLRTIRGRLELVSRVLMGVTLCIVGFGGAFGLGIAAWYFTSHDGTELLAAFLWVIFLAWQLFPVMASAFTETADSSNLLRFPVTYRSYFVIQMVFGSLDPALVLGSLWLFGMAVGVGVARSALFLWAALVLFSFALLNIFLTRMIFAWVERWLANRRTRELLGLLFFVLLIGFQFLGPVMSRMGGRAYPRAFHFIGSLLPLERLLPPGLAASALSSASSAGFTHALAALGALCVYSAVFLWLLSIRVRRQYLGENLSEAVARVTGPKVKSVARPGWELLGVPGGVAAVFEKEARYLSRSGPLLFQFVMPAVILLIFAVVPANPKDFGQNFLRSAPDFVFPIGAAYALLLIGNLSYNVFGGDHAGIQFFFVSPVPFRQVLFAKNLAHACILLFETVAVWLVACALFHAPSLKITLLTFAWLLFAAPVNFAVGDLMSLYAAKKIDLAKFGRQRVSGLTALASMGSHVVTIGLAAVTFVIARAIDNLWIATFLYLLYAAGTIAAYVVVLRKVDAIAIQRRESLISELCRS